MSLNKLNYKIKVIDDFLDKEDYERIKNLKIYTNSNKKFAIYHGKIIGNKVLESSIDNDLLLSLNKYHDKAMNILKELCPEKIKLYEIDYIYLDSLYNLLQGGYEIEKSLHIPFVSQLHIEKEPNE